MRILLCGTGAPLSRDLGNHAGADRAAALANREAQPLVHGDRLSEIDVHVRVVARDDHLLALRELDRAGHVRRAEVELRPVAVEERRVAAALVLREHVDLGLEMRVRGDRARLRQHLAALDVLALDATQERAGVVARLRVVERLVEHLDAGDDRLLDLLVDADDLDLVADLDLSLLDPARDDGAAAGDREDVLDRHQERLVEVARRLRDVGVDRLHQLDDLGRPLRVALERLERRDRDHRNVVARELVLREQLADLHLDELEQLGVVDHVGLVQRDDDRRHLDLAREQDVLTGLRHGAVGGGDDEDRAVHLGGAGDHVLDVVGVPGAVDVRVVTVLRLVLDVGRVDRDAAGLLLGRVVDLVERLDRRVAALLGEHLRDRRRQRGLAVVDVTDRADVQVRLRPFELLLGYLVPPVSFLGLGVDDLARDRLRDFLVAIELHRERGPPLRRRAQIGGVAEHLCQRNSRASHLGVPARLEVLDPAAARVQVAHDVAEVLLRGHDLDGHDRLEELRLGALQRLLEGHRAGDLEGPLARVDLVVGAVGELDAHVDDRIPGEDPGLHRLLDAEVDGRDELLRDLAADDLVDELVALARLGRLEVDDDVAILAAAAGLANEAPPNLLDGLGDSLPIGDLRPADVRVDLELAQQAVDDDLEVQLAHPGDERLPRLLVGPHAEGRILLGETLEAARELVLVALRLRLDRDRDHRVGEAHRLEPDRRRVDGERVPRRRELEADRRGDLAGADLRPLLAVVGVHLEDAADALGLPRRRVHDAVAGLHLAGVDAEVRQLADVRI